MKKIALWLLAAVVLFAILVGCAGGPSAPTGTTAEIVDKVFAASGVESLRRLLLEHFLPRAQTLQGRAVLSGLHGLTSKVGREDAAWLRDELERIEMTAGELSELRLLHLAVTEVVGFDGNEVDEVRRLLLRGDPATRLNRSGAERDELNRAALDGVERWRERAADPRNEPVTVEACQLTAQVYERLFALIAADEYTTPR